MPSIVADELLYARGWQASPRWRLDQRIRPDGSHYWDRSEGR
jgi:hypothetical protein